MVGDQMPSWHRFWASFCDRALNRTIGSDRGPGLHWASAMAAARPRAELASRARASRLGQIKSPKSCAKGAAIVCVNLSNPFSWAGS